MALELESQIMGKIGLGQHYTWFNGSRSCGGVRKQAAQKLPQVIKQMHEQGKEIAAPVTALCNLVWQVASTYGIEVDMFGEPSDDVLTKTWQCASDVIQVHMHLYHAKPEEQQNMINKAIASINHQYIPRENNNRFNNRFSNRYGWDKALYRWGKDPDGWD